MAANKTDWTGDYLKRTSETVCKIKNSENNHNKRVVSDCLICWEAQDGRNVLHWCQLHPTPKEGSHQQIVLLNKSKPWIRWWQNFPCAIGAGGG